MSGTQTNQTSQPPSPSAVTGIDPNLINNVVKQVTGDNPVNTQSLVQGVASGSDKFMKDIGEMLGRASSVISTTFNSTSSNPQEIAQKAGTVAATSAQANIQAGAANAEVNLSKNMALAKQKMDDTAAAVALHMTPNDPQRIAALTQTAQDAKEITDRNAIIQKAKNTDFMSDPLSYLVGNLVVAPFEQARIQNAGERISNQLDASTAQAKQLGISSEVDAKVDSANSIDFAMKQFKADMSTAVANGYEPVRQGLTQQLGAWDLGVAQQNTALRAQEVKISQARLGMEEKLFPLQQEQIKASTGMDIARANYENGVATEMADARIQRAKAALDKSAQDKEVLGNVNLYLQAVGGKGTVTDFNQLPAGRARENIIRGAMNLNETGQIGVGPANTYEILRDSGIPLNNMLPAWQATMKNIGDIYTDTVAKLTQVTPAQMAQGIKAPTGEELQSKVRAAVDQRVMDEQVNWGNESNRFAALPSVGGLINIPSLKDNPVVQYLRPASIDGNGNPVNAKLTGDLLVGAAAKMVQENKLSPSDAVKYLTNAAHETKNNVQTAGGWKAFSIYTQPQNFNLRVGDKIYDLENSAQALQALTKTRADIANPSSTFIAPQGSGTHFIAPPQKDWRDQKSEITNRKGQVVTGPPVVPEVAAPVGPSIGSDEWYRMYNGH